MKINTNISSMSAIRALGNTSKALARALERLATGKRINRAGDDAAGLAIGTGLDAQRRGTLQAIRNMNDAQGFLNTAEGAIAEQTNILQRMRELAMQSANGTLGSADRGYLNSEFQQLVQEYNRIATQTNFNGTSLLDGTFLTSTLQVGTSKGQNISFGIAGTGAAQMIRKTVGTGSFTVNQTLTAGATGNGAANEIVDLNGDGKKDLILFAGLDGIAKIFLGDGTGSFSQISTLSVGANTYPYADNLLTSGDVTGDGIADLVVAAGDEDAISVLQGNGDGTFKQRVTYAAGDGVNAVALADLNGDQALDIVATSFNDAKINVLLNNGNGAFASKVSYNSGINSTDVAVGDINRDGYIDVISTGTFAQVYTYLGSATGALTYLENYGVAGFNTSVELGDLDGDGILDRVHSSPVNDIVTVEYGTGTGTFTGLTNYTFNGANNLKLADLNDDGRLDLVGSSIETSKIGVLFNSGGRQFSSAILSSGVGNAAISVADLNNDGVQDIVASTMNFAVSSPANVLLGATQSVQATSDLSISTQSKAQKLLSLLDASIARLTSSRADIAAISNRIDYASNASSALAENLAAAQSNVMDADVATETAELTRQQILQQAGVSVLAQANSQMQIVLHLLGGLNK